MAEVLFGYAPAKINLFLEVVEKRTDGFHNIDSVFAEIDITDTVTVWKENDNSINLEARGLDCKPEDNLVYKAVDALRRKCGYDGGLGIRLEKNIPAGGGLGGGSSNAALALILANRCWKTGLDVLELQEIGAGIGSDVSFFFHGGVCVCRGRGELVTPIKNFSNSIGIVLVLTGIHCDTASGYRGLRLPSPGEEKHSQAFVDALLTGDEGKLNRIAFNRFEETVFTAYPHLAEVREELAKRLDRPVRLSGSGGSLWFFANYNEAEKLVSNPVIAEWAVEKNVRLLPCRIGGNSNRKA